MARNTPLQNVIQMLKAELTACLISGVATANDVQYASLIANKQRWLADTYDWPFMEQTWTLQIPGGGAGRYNTLPTTTGENTQIAINFERPVLVKVWYSGSWQPVIYGIDEREYNYVNSDGPNGPNSGSPQILDPIQRWRFSEEQANQFEVWPVPSVNVYLRFRGQSAITPLLQFTPNGNNPAKITPFWTNTLDLDDNMVMLFTAGEYLQQLGKGNAQAVMQRAAQRLLQIRSSYPKREMSCAMNQGQLQPTNKVVSMKTPILVAPGKQ